MQASGTLLSTEARAAALGLEVYPNPARAELHLRLPAGMSATNLRLYDAQGRLVAALAAGPHWPLAGLARGLYVLRATVAGQEVSRRVMID